MTVENPFEDIKREYVNRYSETGGLLLADSYDTFVDRMLTAIMVALNGYDDQGHRILDDAMAAALREGRTEEEWSRQKANLMLTIFFLALDECPYLKHEFATHLYNELRKENPHEQG